MSCHTQGSIASMQSSLLRHVSVESLNSSVKSVEPFKKVEKDKQIKSGVFMTKQKKTVSLLQQVFKGKVGCIKADFERSHCVTLKVIYKICFDNF